MFFAPLSLGYLASYARKYCKEKHEFIIIDETMRKDVEKRLREFKPDIVGVSTLTTVSKRAFELAEFCKKNFDSLNVIGGIHATALREKVLDSSFDIAVVGEGEMTFAEILDRKDLHSINGILFKEGDKIITTLPRELIKNIDDIPFPAWDLMDMESYISKKQQIPALRARTINIITTRGCPYNCVFCSCSQSFGRAIRHNSPEYAEKMIESLEKYNIEAIYFSDDTFTINMPRLEKICAIMKRKKLKFFCLGRANLVNKEMLIMLKDSGCVQIAFGFESMSPKILAYLKKNTVTVEQNRNAVKLCKEIGLEIQPYFMIGSPNETREDIQMTVDFIDEEKIIPTIFVTNPYPGTELYDWCKDNGLVPEHVDWEKSLYDHRSDISASNILSKKEIARIYLDLNEKYYMKRSKVDVLRKILLRPRESLKMIIDYVIK